MHAIVLIFIRVKSSIYVVYLIKIGAKITQSSKALSRGLIRIGKDAFGSNGYEKQDCLLMSDKAEADAIPNLEPDFSMASMITDQISGIEIAKSRLGNAPRAWRA